LQLFAKTDEIRSEVSIETLGQADEFAGRPEKKGFSLSCSGGHIYPSAQETFAGLGTYNIVENTVGE
jgi:hypothetical protein